MIDRHVERILRLAGREAALAGRVAELEEELRLALLVAQAPAATPEPGAIVTLASFCAVYAVDDLHGAIVGTLPPGQDCVFLYREEDEDGKPGLLILSGECVPFGEVYLAVEPEDIAQPALPVPDVPQDADAQAAEMLRLAERERSLVRTAAADAALHREIRERLETRIAKLEIEVEDRARENAKVHDQARSTTDALLTFAALFRSSPEARIAALEAENASLKARAQRAETDLAALYAQNWPEKCAAVEARASTLAKGVRAVGGLIEDSMGVAGLHLNGDIAPWSELREGGRYEDWLGEFDAALAMVPEEKL